MNPCGGGAGGAGGGGGRGGGGGAAPLVPGGTYNVALIVDGKSIETKTVKVVMDPAVQMSDVQQKRYFDVVMDLHDMQGRGEATAAAMQPFNTQMQDIAAKLADMKDVPATVKTQFEALNKDFDAARVKFGVGGPAGGGGGRGGRGGGGGGAAAGGGRGGRGGGGRGAAGAAGAGAGANAAAGAPPATAAAVDPNAPPDAAAQAGGGAGGFGGAAPVTRENIVGRIGQVKSGIMAFSEMPSDTLMKEYADVKLAYPRAVSEMNAIYTRASAMVATLKKYELTLTVPLPAK